MDKARILILGAGPAGLNAAEAAVKNGAAVTLAGAEKYLPYWRPRLSKMLSAPVSPEEIAIKPQEWFEENKIQIKINCTAVKIDIQSRKVLFSDESTIEYDKLILATGSHSFVPSIQGAVNPLALRSYDDALVIRDAALKAGRAAVFGGGLLGLETAYSLMESRVQVTVLERASWLLNRQLPQAGGAFLAEFLQKKGISLVLNADTNAQEQLIAGACVIIAAGVRPNIELMQDTGILINRAVIVDDHMQTNIAGVYACGDIAEYNGKCPGLIPIAVEQGRIAGANASGNDAVYTEVAPSPLLKVGTLSVFSAGNNSAGTVFSESTQDTFKSICLKDNILTGGVLIGETSLMVKLKNAIAKKREFPNAAALSDVLAAL